MAVKNLKQLKSVAMREVRKSMAEASKKALEDMNEEAKGFYTGKQPTMYKRTGALGDTPKTTPLSVSGNEISFKAYLDEEHQYTTGKNPTMEDVLNLTKAVPDHNSSVGYLRSVRGKIRFWERAKEKMERDFNETLRKTFK